MDFSGNDIAQFNDVSNWEECGMLAIISHMWKDQSNTGFNLASCLKMSYMCKVTICHKGALIYDVHTRGRRGLLEKQMKEGRFK